jgi:hypothetical protein
MAKLEDEFRRADGKPVLIAETPAQDEGVVVETKVCGVEEEDLPDLREGIHESLAGKVDVGFVRSLPDQLGKLSGAVHGGEAVPLEDDLGLDIVNLVEWMAVTVYASRP